MGFFNREVIRPEVVQPYGPYEDITSQLNQTYDTAQNRSAQKTNQIYGSAGFNPQRSRPALAAKSRGATDIENQRAQQGYDSYYQWLRGKQLSTPQILPSGASTMMSPFVSGLGTAMGPSIVSGAAKGLGSAWDWATSGSGMGGSIGGSGVKSSQDNLEWLKGQKPTELSGYQDTSGYQVPADTWGESADFGWADAAPDFSSAYNEVNDIPWGDFAPDFSGAYDALGEFFGGW